MRMGGPLTSTLSVLALIASFVGASFGQGDASEDSKGLTEKILHNIQIDPSDAEKLIVSYWHGANIAGLKRECVVACHVRKHDQDAAKKRSNWVALMPQERQDGMSTTGPKQHHIKFRLPNNFAEATWDVKVKLTRVNEKDYGSYNWCLEKVVRFEKGRFNPLHYDKEKGKGPPDVTLNPPTIANGAVTIGGTFSPATSTVTTSLNCGRLTIMHDNPQVDGAKGTFSDYFPNPPAGANCVVCVTVSNTATGESTTLCMPVSIP